jgi:O-acetyl-ADP-ribose deacetylase (regulator of RNase III)
MQFIFNSIRFVFYTLALKYWRRNIFSKFATIFAVGSIGVLGTSFKEIVFYGLLNLSTGKELEATSAPETFYILFVASIVFATISHLLAAKIEQELVFERDTLENFKCSNSIIHCYIGSVTNISGIDVVVTSENTDLNLGSISGTSVSGRIRKLAAEKDGNENLIKDHLFDHIQYWKNNQNSLGPYNIGTCVFSPPFNAQVRGVKSIINAVAVKKNHHNTFSIDFVAIENIIEKSISHCISEGFESIFIPVFGLGSGGLSPDKCIDITVKSVIKQLNKTDNELRAFIGVYREEDSLALLKSISKSL